MEKTTILTTKSSAGYELLDSGMGEKLERFGDVLISRPDPQALWPKKLRKSDWDQAVAVFTHAADEKSGWRFTQELPEKWEVTFGELKFWVKPTSFKHTGLFPEQLENWNWLRNIIKKENRPISVLNLFGYTGGATLAAAQAGAEVCHVDGSRSAIAWARENAALSNLQDKKIRWILDDATSFINREIRRGRKYDGIILDPPAFGHGPKKELWKIDESLLPLLEACKNVLSDKPAFFILNGYAAGYSSIAYENNLKTVFHAGNFEKGELAIEESKTGRLLPCGIFARWSKQ
jgi:23S rRNA (cytosine1962-C5)-methyltransferase